MPKYYFDLDKSNENPYICPLAPLGIIILVWVVVARYLDVGDSYPFLILAIIINTIYVSIITFVVNKHSSIMNEIKSNLDEINSMLEKNGYVYVAEN